MVSKSALDRSIDEKMARLKELGINVSSEEPQDPKQATKTYFTLSNGKGGMMKMDLDRGVVLTSELLNSLIVDESDETDSSVIDDAIHRIEKMNLLKPKTTLRLRLRLRHHRWLQRRRKRENMFTTNASIVGFQSGKCWFMGIE
jgi:hypothetical protein